jgi:predicted acetyltransferase
VEHLQILLHDLEKIYEKHLKRSDGGHKRQRRRWDTKEIVTPTKISDLFEDSILSFAAAHVHKKRKKVPSLVS